MDFIDSYAALSDNERTEYEQRFPKESTALTGIVSQAREEGIQQGVQQGVQQGMVQGERTALLRQLRRRFGELDAETEERVASAEADQLNQWLDNVLDARTLDEVFAQT